MSRLVATLTFGESPALGGGLEPVALAHCYADPVARFLGYTVTESGDLERVPGAYAPDPDADRPYPVTDLLLALARDLSQVGDRLDTLDTKAAANYGVDFREKAFDSAVGWESDGYGRHFEARSQLEAHPIDGAVATAVYAPAEPVTDAIAANLARLDVTVLRSE
ncbi:hypothetical protein [Halosegnis sp.]|uniref:hypothetical protein n=1 Tax=Halosegnis sp. TaxID=2864959 RepID=UPI0035D529DB